MKICLLGASGRTGKAVLSQALDRGWEVRALVRDPRKISRSSERLWLIKGNPSHKENLSEAVTNSKRSKPLIVSFNNSPKPKLVISRMSVAQFLLDCVADASYIREKPVISEK